MPATLNLSGVRFGRLVARTATHQTLSSGRKMTAWECQCDCGNIVTCLTVNLRKPGGHTTSCGCYLNEIRGQANVTHGATRWKSGRRKHWPEYSVYRQMLDRCYLTTAPNYHWYGAKGVKVCGRWRTGEIGKPGFQCFIEDMGRRPEGLTIDRINPFGDYEPGNCRWTTWTEQHQNTRARWLEAHRYGVKAA